jgi:hypothetical protein
MRTKNYRNSRNKGQLRATKKDQALPSKKNKKIKNAQALTVDGIEFKSRLEVYTYQQLLKYNLVADYEQHKFQLVEGFHYSGPCLENTVRGVLQDNCSGGKKTLGITYKPDFVCVDPDTKKIRWVIECKGYQNDRFPLVWKMFKKLFIEQENPCPLFKPRNQSQVNQCIKMILEYEASLKT